MNHPKPVLEALRRPVPAELVEELRGRFGDRFSTAAAVREHHGRDESPFDAVPPDAVVLDEMVQLAKEFSTDESPSFVNGLLGRFKELKPTLRREA